MPLKSESVFSVIDLGTNTCLLLIASLSQNKLIKLFEAQEIPRLGKDLYKTGHISPDRFEMVSGIFKKYISISKEYNSEKVLAFATSALREAKNSFEFIQFIEKETGIKISVISGEEESRYGFEGAVFDLNKNVDYAVLDIGGGSSEISYIENRKLNSVSLNIGAVRLFENFFKEKFSHENILKARLFVRENLNNLSPDLIQNKDLTGVAGTVTTLSAIKNCLNEFSEDIIHKDKLSLKDTEIIFQNLINMTDEERLDLGTFMKGRSDIIICGALILIEFMKHFNFNTVLVSTKGVRYGLMLNIADFIY